MKPEPVFYQVVPADFGPVAVIWWKRPGGPRVRQVLLAKARRAPEAVVQESWPGAAPRSAAAITSLGRQIQRFLGGDDVTFDLGIAALEICGEFQRRVLLAEYGIPRGRVSTYARIARRLGAAGAARAVGNALARNPFPIIIPCHRAVKSDGSIGGYQGGSAMKRALLVMEGVEFTAAGRVVLSRVHY